MAEDIEEPQLSEDPFAKYGGKAIEKSEDPFAKYGGKSISAQPKTEQQTELIQKSKTNENIPIVQNVPKETSPYLKGLDFKTITDAIKADKSQQEQQNSTIGALYNSVVGGVKEAATGFLNRAAQSVPSSMGSVGGAPSGTMAGTTEDRAIAAKDIALATGDIIDKARTNASSRENEQSFNFDTNKGIIHNVKSLAFQLPRLTVDLGLGALTNGASFFAQGEGAALEELKNNPEADKLTPNTQAGYVTTVGVVNGVLMKLGFDKIFKATGLEDLAAKKIINEVTSDLVKRGVKATTKDIEDAALRKATSFMTKANNVGIGALKSTLTGGGIGAVQAASDDAIKLLVDKASGVDVFNSQDIKENFPKHLLTSVIQGGATGLVMGLGHGMFENTNKAIRLKMAEAKTPQDIENIKQNINQQVESGNITPEQAQAANIKIQDYAQIAAKIPEEITSDRKYAIIGGIEQREGIKNEIQSTQDELNSTDEAFQSDKNAKLELLNAKLLQTNDYIDGLVTGEKTKYSEENGVYYKTDANGDKIPISKQHYELGSAAEENDKKQTIITIPKVEETTTIEPTDNIKVGEMLDKTGTYKGVKGSFTQEGQTVIFKEEGKDRIHEIGNIDEVKNMPISDFDIKHEESIVSVDNDGNFNVRNEVFVNPFEQRGQNPIDAILYDKDGNVVNVRMKTADGKRRTFKGNIAEDLAYQIHLKEINKNNETRAAFEQHINEDTEAQNEINNAGLPKTTEGGTVESTEQVPQQEVVQPKAKVVKVKVKPIEVVSEEEVKPTEVKPKVEEKGDLQSQYDSIKSDKAKKNFITKNFGEVSDKQLSEIIKNNTDLNIIKDKIDALPKLTAEEVANNIQKIEIPKEIKNKVKDIVNDNTELPSKLNAKDIANLGIEKAKEYKKIVGEDIIFKKLIDCIWD